MDISSLTPSEIVALIKELADADTDMLRAKPSKKTISHPLHHHESAHDHLHLHIVVQCDCCHCGQ